MLKISRESEINLINVLIEAFIVEADSEFEKALGSRLGAAYNRKGKRAGGLAGASSANDASVSYTHLTLPTTPYV